MEEEINREEEYMASVDDDPDIEGFEEEDEEDDDFD